MPSIPSDIPPNPRLLDGPAEQPNDHDRSRNFQVSYDLANQLLERATKNQLADVARGLAINLALYRLRFGDLPVGGILRGLRDSTPDAETVETATEGMQALADALRVFLGPTGVAKRGLH
jgi:hypothetical protein